MTFDELFDAMMRVADAFDIDVDYATFMSSKRRARIEATAHELAHGICLGKPMPTRAIEKCVYLMDDADADAHELEATRVEIAALKRLGLAVSIWRIVAVSAYREEFPTRRQAYAPLTHREQTLVNKMVKLVKTFAG